MSRFRTAVRSFRARNRLTRGVPAGRFPVPRPDAVASAVPGSGLPRLVVRIALILAGFGLLSAAAWNAGTGWGLAVTGVSCLVVEWTFTDEPRRQ